MSGGSEGLGSPNAISEWSRQQASKWEVAGGGRVRGCNGRERVVWSSVMLACQAQDNGEAGVRPAGVAEPGTLPSDVHVSHREQRSLATKCGAA
jgi:hypothetical protein